MPSAPNYTISTDGTLTVKPHVGLKQTIANSLTMAYRGLLKMKHTPDQLVDVMLQPILFTLMFTFLFGGAIAGSVSNYLPLLIPGILIQAITGASLTTGSQLREDMDKGVFNRFKSLPIARIAPLAGALTADIVRYVICTTLTFVMGYLLGYRPAAGPTWVIAAGLLAIVAAWCVSWIFAYLGMVCKSAQSVTGIGNMVMMPLTFLSNAFVPVDTLPHFLQVFVKINPITHLIAALRAMCNAGTITADFWWTLAGLAAILAIFVPLTLRSYLKKA
jgi:ABC-2 type transport system permease protein